MFTAGFDWSILATIALHGIEMLLACDLEDKKMQQICQKKESRFNYKIAWQDSVGKLKQIVVTRVILYVRLFL